MTLTILISPQELENWLDEFIIEQMKKLHIPGVAISVVQKGELFFTKGYGYADLEQQIPVVAKRTLFRIGGITKLFTATAIMQLVEKELLDLEDNINKYLPKNLQPANNYSQPITIANLLTHTAGFNSRYIGVVRESSDVIPLPEYIKHRMPTRVSPPSETIIFGNDSYGMLGYIVELVANIPFNQYVKENILQPLDMDRSSFELSFDSALSYRYVEKQKTARIFSDNSHQITFTDALNATATDMANFAIANLQYGKFKSRRILDETTARQMQQRQFSNDPLLPGMCLGFREYLHPKYQQRGIGHDGGVLLGYRSLFYLLPQYDLGFFVANNGCGKISGQLIEQFSNRYFPVAEDYYQRSQKSKQSIKRYQGSYRSNHYSQKTLDKINLLWTSPLRLKATTDGTLTIPQTIKSDNPVYLQEIEPSVLQVQNHADNYVVAKEDNNNKVTALLSLGGILKKLAWYETNTFHWMLFWCFVLVFLSGFTVSFWTLIRFPGDNWHQLARLLAIATCGLNLICAFGMLVIARLSKNNERLKLVYGVPRAVTVLLCILLLTCVLAVGLLVVTITVWINSEWSFAEQIYYSLVALTALGLIPYLKYWNLLGFQY